MKLAVLISGNGSNLAALIDAVAADASFGASIEVVISDNPDAFGLHRATEAGIPTGLISWSDRTAGTEQLLGLLDQYSVDAVVLAGFMRILGPAAIARYPESDHQYPPFPIARFSGEGRHWLGSRPRCQSDWGNGALCRRRSRPRSNHCSESRRRCRRR